MGRIKLDPCFDCGSEDIYWNLNNWQLICRNCEAECPLPNEPLNKIEMARCWNQMQEEKLQSQSDGHDKMAGVNDQQTAEEAAREKKPRYLISFNLERHKIYNTDEAALEIKAILEEDIGNAETYVVHMMRIDMTDEQFERRRLED